VTIATQKLTLKEYLTYAAGADACYELVDGELLKMALGTGKHSDISDFLADEFRDAITQMAVPWIAKAMKLAIQSPRGTRWETARIPDVAVLLLEQWQSMTDREAFIPLNEPAPLLVVEVVSASTVATDYRTKYAEYAVLDIPEYWIVDPIASQVVVCILSDGFYLNQDFAGDTLIVSPTFPRLNLTAAQVLQGKR
jgi:Uma2 family endonuclease